jgi:hypothetical protein
LTGPSQFKWFLEFMQMSFPVDVFIIFKVFLNFLSILLSLAHAIRSRICAYGLFRLSKPELTLSTFTTFNHCMLKLRIIKPNWTVNHEPNQTVSVWFQNCWLWFNFFWFGSVWFYDFFAHPYKQSIYYH